MSEIKLERPTRQLTLFDSTCVIVGIIIGVGIFETTPRIAQCVGGPTLLLLVWLAGGAISLLGALCYAELVSAHPKQGGDYVFLSRAYGRQMGFLFAWSDFWIVRPGSVGAMAFVFAHYASLLWPLPTNWSEYAFVVFAIPLIVLLTIINILGVRQGKWTQNTLTVIKVAGLLIVVVVAVAAPPDVAPSDAPPSDAPAPEPMGLPLALIFVLFTYGGWNEIAYVGAEVKNPGKNALRSLLLGTLAVTVIYLLVNGAFLYALGFQGVQQSEAVAADAVDRVPYGSRAISALVCLSAMGSINGHIFTGARIYYALGTEHTLFAPLGRWSRRFGTPVVSLASQGVVTVALIVLFGTPLWSRFIGAVTTTAADGAAPAAFEAKKAFEKMVIFTTPAFWSFLLLVILSLLILRRREPNTARPFRVPLYPWIPLLFGAVCLFMIYSSLDYAYHKHSYEAYWSIGILVVGVAMSFWNRRRSGAADQEQEPPA